MHVIADVDYFFPTPFDTTEILSGNTDPRVKFEESLEDKIDEIRGMAKNIAEKEIPFDKLVIADYLVHGLDYCSKGSKRKMKDTWPNQLEQHELGGDEGLVLPLSMRAAKSVIRLSQALDEIVKEKSSGKSEVSLPWIQ